MAPMLDVLTDIYHVDYEGPHGRHSLQFRFPAGTAVEVEQAAAISIVNALKVFVPVGVSFLGARVQAAASPNSFPTTWSPIAGTNATNLSGWQYPQFISFVGRSLEGRRVRVTLQGAQFANDDDYRLPAQGNAQVTAVLTQLKTAAPQIRTIAGTIPVWNEYANIGWNAYFQRKRRRVA